ncbi:MAG: CoA pyrophosphatase [Gammaproteobacteria bacterium]|nr:CoA pyrophosphatase [Gammaproteobacteria bacterium]
MRERFSGGATSQEFIPLSSLEAAFSGPLPGRSAQATMSPRRMAAQQVDRWDPPALHRKAAVLLLLYPGAAGTTIVLIRRPQYEGVHSGQIALPGGAWETGESLLQTALREAEEEVGVDPAGLRVLGGLSQLYIPVSNFNIHPFVAVAERQPVFQPDPIEVAEIIQVPLGHLLHPDSRGESERDLRSWGPTLVPHIDAEGHVIWGATAMILAEFLNLLEGVGVDRGGASGGR